MTRPWTAGEVAAAARRQNSALQAELGWLDEQRRQHRQDLGRVDGEEEAAWQHLCELLVPDLSAEHLDRVAAACQLPSVSSAAVLAEQREAAQRLRERIAEIDATPDYVDREGVLNECEIRLEEYDDLMKPLRDQFAAILAEEKWQRLSERGYGTPSYAGKWYQLSYYRDWKEGDELVEHYGPTLGASEWGPLRAKVEEAEQALASLQGERDRYAARKAAVEVLIRQRTEQEMALAAMPARQLASVRGRLRGHLGALEVAAIGAMLPGDAAVAVALQRLAGVAAKRRYLVEAARTYLDEPRTQIADALARNNRDIAKLSRPKHAGRQFPAETMTKRFRDRSAAVSKRRQRYEDTRTQVVAFDGYDRGSLVSDFLWWDVMTDGRLDGDFIPEVHQHHALHPRDHHADAVAAVAGAPARDADALLIHDGS